MVKEKLKRGWLGKLWTMAQVQKASYIAKRTVAPYEEKRLIIKGYKEQHGLNIFIETGTFLGDTIQSMRDLFKKLYSIELSEELATKAQQRFHGDSKIEILQGNSGVEIKKILRDQTEPCLFWLDGHYSSEFFIGNEFIKTAKGDKETPIMEELEAILKHSVKGHVILIDDARCFNGKGDYPRISELKTAVRSWNPSLNIEIKRDIIRLIPK